MKRETIIRRAQVQLEKKYRGVVYTWSQNSYESDGSGAIYNYTVVARGHACGKRESRSHKHGGQCGRQVIHSGSVYVSF